MAGDASPNAPLPGLGNLAGAPCRVERVLVVGLHRTQAAVVQAELRRVKEARTLEELRDAALRAYEELTALDIFDAVDVVLGEGTKGNDTCTVVARFQEKGLVRLHAGTYVQGTEGECDSSTGPCTAAGSGRRSTP